MSLRCKWEHDLATGAFSPIPTQVVASDEYAPIPPTREQQRVGHRLRELSVHHAARLAMSRREFLSAPCGMAAAFVAMNEVFGRFFEVDAVEAWEASAVRERQPQDQFVFDVHTHHVATGLPARFFFAYREQARQFDPTITSPRVEDAYLANYIKEMFLDSDTTLAIITGVPSVTPAHNFLPVDGMAMTRNVVNELAGSRRLLSHGLLAPTQGERNLDEMERQAAELKVEGWKGYTGGLLGSAVSWAVDDEKISYPMLEKARRLGVRNICLHKGLPQRWGAKDGWHPRDIAKAARDFPDLNFIVYHSGVRAIGDVLSVDVTRAFPQLDWVTDLCEMRRKNPRLTNVYAELGSVFGLTVITKPMVCAYMLGLLIKTFGADHVIWGTDSIWWGSPRWQIEAFRRLIMPDILMTFWRFDPLTPNVKAQILGLNAARLFGVDPNAMVNPVPNDFVSKLKAAYRQEGLRPSLTQYGWIAT